MEGVKLVECPRDAMQGIGPFIPTDVKVAYLNTLLKVGFDSIDIGSFVSPRAIPQLADTPEVLARIDRIGSRSKLLVIVANERGAEEGWGAGSGVGCHGCERGLVMVDCSVFGLLVVWG